MAEPSTRDFISQWPFDQSQEREDVQDGTRTRWRSVNQVAERKRQWEGHQLEFNSDPMDFEARSAAIEAHCFQTRRKDTPEYNPKLVNLSRKSPRIRPQSASYVRRSNDINCSKLAQPRPKSAKTRSENASSTGGAKDNAAWKFLAQNKSSKWRDMLARSPEFKQLNLRILELETYELLYKSCHQSQMAAKKTTRRRRQRQEIGSSTGSTSSGSPTVPCGSAIHLARSRKERQQEHDRRMMLGESRRSSSTSSRTEDKISNADKFITQEKNRKRSTILKAKSQNQLQEPQASRVTSWQKRQELSSQHQPSTYRSARAPWLLSSPKLPRGVTSNGTSAMHASRAEHTGFDLEEFRSQADKHLRQTKQIVNKLRKAHQRVQATPNRPWKTKQMSKRSTQHEQTTQRTSINPASRHSNNREVDPDIIAHLGSDNHVVDEFDDQKSPPHEHSLDELSRLTVEQEARTNLEPGITPIVIPPLKLPVGGVHESQAAGTWDEDDPDETFYESAKAGAFSENGDPPPRDLDWYSSKLSTAHGVAIADAEYSTEYTSEDEPMSQVLEDSLWAQGHTSGHELWSVKSSPTSAWTEEKSDATTASNENILIAEEQRVQHHEHDTHVAEQATNQKGEAIEEHNCEDGLILRTIDNLPALNPKGIPIDLLQGQDTTDGEEFTPEVNTLNKAVSDTIVQSRSSSHTSSFWDEKELCVDQRLDDKLARTPDSNEDPKCLLSVTDSIGLNPFSPNEDVLVSAADNAVLEQTAKKDAKSVLNSMESEHFSSTPGSPCNASNFDLLLHHNQAEVTNAGGTEESGRHGYDDQEGEGDNSVDDEVKIADGSDNQSPESKTEVGHSQQRTTGIDDPGIFGYDASPRIHEPIEVTEAPTSSSSHLNAGTVSQTPNKVAAESTNNCSSPLELTSADLGEQNTLASISLGTEEQTILETSMDLGQQDNDNMLLDATLNNTENGEEQYFDPKSSILESSDEKNASASGYDTLLSAISGNANVSTREKLSPKSNGEIAGLTIGSASIESTLIIEAPQAISDTYTYATVVAAVHLAEETGGCVVITSNLEGRENSSDPACGDTDSSCKIESDASALSYSKLNGRDSISSIGGGCPTAANANDEGGASDLVHGTVEVVDKGCRHFQPVGRVEESECLSLFGKIMNPESSFSEVSCYLVDAPFVHSAANVPPTQGIKNKKQHESVALDDEKTVDNSSSELIFDKYHSPRLRPTTDDADIKNDESRHEQGSLSRQTSTRSFLMHVAGSKENKSTNSGLEPTVHRAQSSEEIDTAPDVTTGVESLSAEVSTTAVINDEHEVKMDKEDGFGEKPTDDVCASDSDCITVAKDPAEDIPFQSPLQLLDERIDYELSVKVLAPAATCASTSVVELQSSVQELQRCDSPVETQPHTQEDSIAIVHDEDDIKVESSTAIEGKTWMPSTTTVDTNAELLIDQEPGRSTDRATTDSERDNPPEQLSLSLQPESTATKPSRVVAESEVDANENIEQESTERFHKGARQVQAQYRCFIQRRLLFDQLRFLVAKHRRQSRRAKSRRKTKTVNADIVAPVACEAEECPVEVMTAEADVKTIDTSVEEADKTPTGQVISECDSTIPSDLPAIYMDSSAELLSPPMEDTTKSLARNDSCEYAFDLFDNSSGALDVEVQAQNDFENDDDGVTVIIGTTDGQVTARLADPHTLGTRATAPRGNEDAGHVRHRRHDSLQVEREMELEESMIERSSTNEVESSLQRATSRSVDHDRISTFDKEPKATDTVIMDTSKVGSRWERYMDNSTGKSWYFNPSTNVSQWTAPESASIIDNAKAPNPHATPTMQQEAAPDVEVVRPNGSAPEPLSTWQEFLDEASGQLFYYNAKTGESSWMPPSKDSDPIGVVASPESVSTAAVAAGATSAWVMYIDPATQAPYYVNVETLATSWEPPADFAVASTLASSEGNVTTIAD